MVLLVEDNPGDARLVEILLSEIGYVVGHTDTLGWTLEELVSSMAWNAVLFDLALPEAYKASSPGWGSRTAPGLRRVRPSSGWLPQCSRTVKEGLRRESWTRDRRLCLSGRDVRAPDLSNAARVAEDARNA